MGSISMMNQSALNQSVMSRLPLALSPEMMAAHQQWRLGQGPTAAELEAMLSHNNSPNSKKKAGGAGAGPEVGVSGFDVARPGTAVGLEDRIDRPHSPPPALQSALSRAGRLSPEKAGSLASAMGDPLLDRIWTVVWPEASNRIAERFDQQLMALPQPAALAEATAMAERDSHQISSGSALADAFFSTPSGRWSPRAKTPLLPGLPVPLATDGGAFLACEPIPLVKKAKAQAKEELRKAAEAEAVKEAAAREGAARAAAIVARAAAKLEAEAAKAELPSTPGGELLKAGGKRVVKAPGNLKQLETLSQHEMKLPRGASAGARKARAVAQGRAGQGAGGLPWSAGSAGAGGRRGQPCGGGGGFAGGGLSDWGDDGVLGPAG